MNPVSDRVDRLDTSVIEHIRTGGTSAADRRSLLALHAALAGRKDFAYLEIGSYLGASLQSFIADPRCRRIVSVDRRKETSRDERAQRPEYPENTSANMLAHLARVPGADLAKLMSVDAATDELDAAELTADLCFVDAEHTNAAVLRDARFCRRAIRDRGVIVFHDRTLVAEGIRRFLGELPRYRAYPLAHELLVIELNVPTLLVDPRVRAQVPRRFWLLADRLRATAVALRLSAGARRLAAAAGRALLRLGAPRRAATSPDHATKPATQRFEVCTFVTDDLLYEEMRASFVAAGFSPDAFVRLSHDGDDPYRAIPRLARESKARYPILCHQDVRAGPGAEAAELLVALDQLDASDDGWMVAGTAGVTRGGLLVRALVDPHGGRTGDPLPCSVVSLDENVLIFNGRRHIRCSTGLSGFHLYGTDVCLNALDSGGAAYVIDFPVTHLSGGKLDAQYERAKDGIIEAWDERCLFRYVVTPSDTLFMSRYRILRRLFGSALLLTCVGQYRSEHRLRRHRRWSRNARPDPATRA